MIAQAELGGQAQVVLLWYLRRIRSRTRMVHGQYLCLPLFDQEVLEYETIHLTFGKCVKRILRRICDRFTFEIEGSVEQDWNARGLPKALNQTVIPRALIEKN